MEALRLMKKMLFALVVILLLIITSPAQARVYHVHTIKLSKTHAANPFKGMKHQRLKVARKGTVLVYHP